MVQQILIHAVNPATALPHAWLNKAKSQRLILKGKIDAEQNWTGAKVGVFCPPPHITICIHQEPNPGQQSVLSSCIQSEQRWCL